MGIPFSRETRDAELPKLGNPPMDPCFSLLFVSFSGVLRGGHPPVIVIPAVMVRRDHHPGHHYASGDDVYRRTGRDNADPSKAVLENDDRRPSSGPNSTILTCLSLYG